MTCPNSLSVLPVAPRKGYRTVFYLVFLTNAFYQQEAKSVQAHSA